MAGVMAKPPAPTRKFVSIVHFARELGVSESFVRKLADAGTIRSLRLKGRILIPADEGERLLQSLGHDHDPDA
jgi:excisionase family DNA binding protein